MRPAVSACSTPPCWWRLWQFDKEDLLAGLLLFRLLYYLAPFVVALVILGTREMLIYMRGRKAEAATAGGRPQATPLRSEIEAKTEKIDAD